MSRTLRPRTLTIGALALLLAAAPFVPRGGDDHGVITPSADSRALLRHATAGASALTPDARAEIDRIAGAALTQPRNSARATPAALVTSQVRCADFEGQTYCLHQGWTDQTQQQVQADATAETNQIAARSQARRTTGDADLLTVLQRSASLTPAQRAAADRAELTEAARAVAKVWLLRNQIEGVPLPDGFLERHPEIRVPSSTTAARAATATATASPSPNSAPTVKPASAYPQHDRILNPARTAEQTRTYYCGPTSMQMITWNWSGSAHSQEYWASKLGTTSKGTSITDMVRVTNSYTGWDDTRHAGPYVVLDIKDFSFSKWYLLQMRHITDYHAPVILHPILLKAYYPYLDDDASGHFQVGRGYDQNGDKTNLIGYFEPWNQQRFDPSEPYIARVQWRSAYKSYRANLAHFQHNIGV